MIFERILKNSKNFILKICPPDDEQKVSDKNECGTTTTTTDKNERRLEFWSPTRMNVGSNFGFRQE